MAALITIRNDGPDDAFMVFGGNPRDERAPAKRIGCGEELRVAIGTPFSVGRAEPIDKHEPITMQYVED